MKKLWKMILDLYIKYKEMILYLVFGGLTTLLNIVSYALFARLLKMDTLIANGLALTVSILFAYVTNKLFVFASKTETWEETFREFVSFIVCRLATGALDMLIMYVTVDVLHLFDLLMKILSNIIVIVLNFVCSKLVIFRKK